jgi:uncharacterized membrane protein SpoIIM required for sporulation
MVLEFLVGYELKKPPQLFLTGVFFSSVSVLVSAALFSHAPSMVVVAFMTLPMVYIFTGILREEAMHETESHELKVLVKENMDLAEIYLYLFLGMVVGVAIWFAVLPKPVISNLFSEQLYNLGQIGVPTGFAVNPEVFSLIAINNIKLVVLCALLSFVFSAGALFVLSWNASVVGVAVGSVIYRLQEAGTASGVAVAQGITLGTAFYILHLVPEVLAYFFASVAGAFISSAMMRYEPFSKPSNRLVGIAVALLGVSIAFILLGAVIETYISHQIQLVLRI